MNIIYLLLTKRALKCSLVVLGCITVSPVLSQVDSEADDAVMKFYLNKAAAAYQTRHALIHGVSFSFEARTFYKYIDKKGRVTSIDSARGRYYYSFGELDSVVNDTFFSKPVPEFDFDYPDVFSDDYRFNFFPNDTGGPEVAIGFDTDSIGDARPVGLAVLNRPIYDMSRLYLHFPEREKYKYFSRIFRFTSVEGYQFPDSIWEVGAIRGFVSSRYFRLETGITNITIYP